jgi:hypothetical protein
MGINIRSIGVQLNLKFCTLYNMSTYKGPANDAFYIRCISSIITVLNTEPKSKN